jgi:hypothetical protein
MGDLYAEPHVRQTICEMHRRMYRIIVSRDPNDELIPLLRRAFDMGKKMGNRLRYHRDKHGDEWWELHKVDGGEIDSDDA